MTENFDNKISRLELTNFTCFSHAEFDFSSGINVFIGENGTGKTHILKLLHSFISINKKNYPKKYTQSTIWGLVFSENIGKSFGVKYFQERLVNTKSNSNILKISLAYNNQSVKLEQNHAPDEIPNEIINKNNADENAKHMEIGIDINDLIQFPIEKVNSLYINHNDILSTYRDILTLDKEREHSFDLTYILLASYLSDKPLRNRPNWADEIEKGLNIEVIRKGDDFFIKFNNQEKEIHSSLVATGINKLAQLIYLIMNGSLTKDSILFWDEPEVNLNPKYISLVAKFLQVLAKAGVQIFVATHDYLLVHQLSLAAEYKEQTDAPSMKFFSLEKGENGTEVESGDTLVEINHNAILDEYAAFYDLEKEYFLKSKPQ